ncbi:MAG: protein-glutamate O-methyltransferase [Pseudomonadota bacterium]
MATVARSLDIPFSAEDFDRVAALAHDRIGLHLEAHKRDLVYGRLAKRLRKLGLSSFKAYFDLLADANGEVEEGELLSLLTTNVTHFFREQHHFEQMRDDIFPRLIKRAQSGQRVRLWSAGCSQGQEAYSLALTIKELCPNAAQLDIRILATDVDPKVLKVGFRGQYPEAELDGIPKRLRQIGTTKPKGGFFEIEPTTRSLVTFGELNLVKPWPTRGSFDVIFCRNVAIYFDKQTQEKLWMRFAKQLRAGAQLVVGHSERVTGPATAFLSNDGVTSYRKSDAKTHDDIDKTGRNK